jgi:aminoglycoside phosphotransferase (APT) family kinase protein
LSFAVQVWRWAQQYRAQLKGEPLKEMEAAIAWLQSNIPASDGDASAGRIAHGDFRMDNLIYAPGDPGRVLAVLDWELSTLGHPFADLAYNCMPYHLPAGFAGLPGLPDKLPPGRGCDSLLGACWVRGCTD